MLVTSLYKQEVSSGDVRTWLHIKIVCQLVIALSGVSDYPFWLWLSCKFIPQDCRPYYYLE